MKIKSVNLETVCGYTSTLPENTLPEIAFAGKSNVGKSSLINVLMERKSLARISSRPGKTQTINFYNINDVMYLTDLPGYGYANVSIEEKGRWGEMIENYLQTSEQLCAVFLLVDIRHEPSDDDRMMVEWIAYQGLTPVIVATKADKIKKSRLQTHLQHIRDALAPDGNVDVIPFSAVTGEGREMIWARMETLIGYNEEEKPQQTQPARSPNRKPRRKDTGKPPAKKTQRMAKKKAAKKQKRR